MAAPAGLPNLIVIGAQKCGTSSLHRYLALHPQIGMSRVKELDFYLAHRTWSRGTEWYAGQFDPAMTVRGESSPNYTDLPLSDGTAERMFDHATTAATPIRTPVVTSAIGEKRRGDARRSGTASGIYSAVGSCWVR